MLSHFMKLTVRNTGFSYLDFKRFERKIGLRRVVLIKYMFFLSDINNKSFYIIGKE